MFYGKILYLYLCQKESAEYFETIPPLASLVLLQLVAEHQTTKNDNQRRVEIKNVTENVNPVKRIPAGDVHAAADGCVVLIIKAAKKQKSGG